uniref:SPARC n=1 Tax=Cacopsylla melanoneura TaxID=428564 RepID=A0A8D8WMC4_9HEMI
MKFLFLLFITLAVLLLLHDVSAQDTEEVKPVKKKHHKKHHRKSKTTTTTVSTSEAGLEVKEESYFDHKTPDEDVKDVISRKMLMERLGTGEGAGMIPDEQVNTNIPQTQAMEERQPMEIRQDEVRPIDPCSSMHCSAGKVCQVNVDGEASCSCIKQCPQELEARRKVCTNYNETFGSDCEVYQKRCECEENMPECIRPDYAHVHIEYYGECRDMPECLSSEMADFPRRMRDWLFYIMRDLADREELSAHYMQLEKEAEGNLTRRWNNAAVWKFCELDGHPADRSISRHELFPIRAPLMALEHCIAPFLNKCDADDDHLITLKEWARCLELNEDEIEDKCDDVRGDDA